MDGDLADIEPTDTMIEAGVRELKKALPPDSREPQYMRDLCRVIWLAMWDASDA